MFRLSTIYTRRMKVFNLMPLLATSTVASAFTVEPTMNGAAAANIPRCVHTMNVNTPDGFPRGGRGCLRRMNGSGRCLSNGKGPRGFKSRPTNQVYQRAVVEGETEQAFAPGCRRERFRNGSCRNVGGPAYMVGEGGGGRRQRRGGLCDGTGPHGGKGMHGKGQYRRSGYHCKGDRGYGGGPAYMAGGGRGRGRTGPCDGTGPNSGKGLNDK